MKKFPVKRTGFVVWFLICLVGGFYFASQTKGNNGQQIMILAGVVWFVGLVVWVIALIKRMSGDRRHELNSMAIGAVALVIFLIVAINVVSGMQTATTTTPTKVDVWQTAMITLGMDPNTPKPQQKDLKGLICAHFPQTNQKDVLCGKAADDLWKNDLQAFQKHWAKNSALVVQNADQKAADAIRIQPATFEIVVTWTILEAIIAAFFSISIDGLGKAKWGTLIWAVLGLFVGFGIVGSLPTNAEASLFGVGAMMRGVATLVAFVGLGLTVAKGAIKGSSASSRFFLRIVFALVGGVLGCFAESLLQIPIVTGFVADGKVSMNAAYFAYQMGTMFGGAVTALFSTLLLMAQAALAK